MIIPDVGSQHVRLALTSDDLRVKKTSHGGMYHMLKLQVNSARWLPILSKVILRIYRNSYTYVRHVRPV
jgi:hypothetical protein